jgi:ATP-binding cassette subfamily B protein
VDVHTEAAIIEATERLMAGRTTFMIAHRLGTLKSCDLILVMEQGELVEIKTNFAEPSSAMSAATAAGVLA